jgi:ATP-dependent helicase/nuclease subunit A
LQALASTILSQRDKFNAVPEAERQARLRRHLKLDHLPTDQTPQPQAVAEAHIEAYRQAAPDLAKWLGAAKSVTDNKRANQLAEFMELVKAGQMDAAWACLNRVFVTQKGQPVARLATAGSAQDNPEAMTALQQWADAFYEALALYRASINYQLTDAMNVFARHLLHDYAAVKEQRGVLDYDDLIARTNEMLAQSRAAAWVLFKIDSGLEHILVDEAQDTSPAQWRVIRALAEEFFSGDTAQQTTRTIFAVGDEKQSIFSFQGADPAGFDEQYQYFSNMIESIGGTVNYVPLQMSWRSAPEILHLVDALFASPENAHGLSAAGKPTAHMAQREESTG